MESDLPLSGMRAHYRFGELLESEAHGDPFVQFNRWMNEAILENLFEPNALSLATVNLEGQPSCRTVLLKAILQEGFIFYTNYDSRKGRELAGNSHAAMLFWWREHERQVRIEGRVSKIPRQMSEDYFRERPIGSRVSAAISPQSTILKDRSELDRLYLEGEALFREREPDCPDNWGGFILEPKMFEFWQGRPNRLHDRLQYTLKDGSWDIVRLAP